MTTFEVRKKHIKLLKELDLDKMMKWYPTLDSDTRRAFQIFLHTGKMDEGDYCYNEEDHVWEEYFPDKKCEFCHGPGCEVCYNTGRELYKVTATYSVEINVGILKERTGYLVKENAIDSVAYNLFKHFDIEGEDDLLKMAVENSYAPWKEEEEECPKCETDPYADGEECSVCDGEGYVKNSISWCFEE